MKHTVISNFFISDLDALFLRQRAGGAARVIPSLAATAVFINQAATASREQLTRFIEIGERAHGLRNGDMLHRIGQAILDLPLGAKASHVGDYYTALAINRRGPEAYPEANKLLVNVAENGPDAFRAKAMIALGANLTQTGDRDEAMPFLSEARQLAIRCGSSGVHPFCILEIQNAFFQALDGNRHSAIASLKRLLPLVRSVASQYPTLLWVYYNNLAIYLHQVGEVQEARSLQQVLKTSPFLKFYPEWQDTCARIEPSTRESSRSLILMGDVFSAPSNLLWMPSRNIIATAITESAGYSREARRATVLSFSKEKKRIEQGRKRGVIPRPTLSGPDALQKMTFQQKQAFALRVLLSDGITERELDQFIAITGNQPN